MPVLFASKREELLKDSIYQLRPEMRNLADIGQNFLQAVAR
jgi:hypothetical protein